METSTQQYRRRVKWVTGPDGNPLTLGDLPPPGTERWVVRRKAEVVAAVAGGLLSLDEACERYMLTVDEFLHWTRTIKRFGVEGLRTTKIQDYRDLELEAEINGKLTPPLPLIVIISCTSFVGR